MNQDITGEPFLTYKNVTICYDCYTDIIPEIYGMSGFGDGGLIWYLFDLCLKSPKGKKKRKSLSKKIFNRLLFQYNFKCCYCNSTKELSIDHIQPVSKGGTDEFSNLQILCKPCNSRKGAKWNN